VRARIFAGYAPLTIRHEKRAKSGWYRIKRIFRDEMAIEHG
jgi:hypothetical protein